MQAADWGVTLKEDLYHLNCWLMEQEAQCGFVLLGDLGADVGMAVKAETGVGVGPKVFSCFVIGQESAAGGALARLLLFVENYFVADKESACLGTGSLFEAVSL